MGSEMCIRDRYYMLTGVQPFSGETPSDVSAAILTRAPRATSELGIRLPPELQKLLTRCFSKTPGLRPTAAEILGNLKNIARSHGRRKEPTDTEQVIPAAADLSAVTAIAALSDTVESPTSPREASAIRYAQSGEVNIAWQEIGNGPIDLVFVMGWVSHLEWFWKHPTFAAFLKRLAAFSRVILFDKRGTGLSDKVPVNELPTLEMRMDDVRAVMDAAGSERAVLCGVSEGGPLCTCLLYTSPSPRDS